MRVGIDVSILSSRLTGIGHFTLSLVRALATLQENVEWVLLGANPTLNGLPKGDNVVTHKEEDCIGWRRAVWQQTALPRLASRYALDVLHCPDFSRPIRVFVPVVNTIHDLSYYSSHAYFPLAKRTYKRWLTRVAMTRSSRIVAVSKFTRDELTERFGLDGPKISVIYHGIDPMPRGEAVPGVAPFVLYVGTLEERKNLVTLVQGFALMRTQSGLPHRLILTGKPGHGFDKIQAAIRTCPSREAVDVPGYVSRERVLQLYRGADALVLPSLYEGFGLPVLEAMTCGTPVVCSRAASLPEVAGDAAEYFDPRSAEELATVLEKVLSSTELQSEMRRKGLRRTKLFSWEECARKHLEVYRSVLD